MQIKMFTVYDSKAEAYLPPFYMQSTGQAVRSFEDTVNDTAHSMHKHASDYTLFEIGHYDDSTAQVDMLKTPISLGTALEHQTQQSQPLGKQSLTGVK